jgi:hypothetical protein
MKNISEKQFEKLKQTATLIPELCRNDGIGLNGLQAWSDWWKLPDGRVLQAWGNTRPEKGWRVYDAGEIRLPETA